MADDYIERQGDFNKFHPEMEVGEMFLYNDFEGLNHFEITKHPFDVRRGNVAYDVCGKVCNMYGKGVPVFCRIEDFLIWKRAYKKSHPNAGVIGIVKRSGVFSQYSDRELMKMMNGWKPNEVKLRESKNRI